MASQLKILLSVFLFSVLFKHVSLSETGKLLACMFDVARKTILRTRYSLLKRCLGPGTQLFTTNIRLIGDEAPPTIIISNEVAHVFYHNEILGSSSVIE